MARTSYLSAMKFLFGLRSFRHMAAASSLFAIGSYAMNVFAPAFLMRTHGMTSAEAGLGLGLVSGIGGLVGTFAGGMLADVLGKRDTRWRQWVPAIAMAVCVPVALGAWLAPDALVSFAPTFSAAQSLAPDEIRATASAVLLFCLTIVGSSAGPYVIGWASDYLTPRFGHLSLRYAMCLLAVTMAWSALHFFLAARALKEDLAAQQLERDRVVPA